MKTAVSSLLYEIIFLKIVRVAGWLAPLIAVAFDELRGQYASNPDNGTDCYAEWPLICSIVMTITSAYPQRDDQPV